MRDAVAASRLAVGSSAISTFGAKSKARATATRWHLTAREARDVATRRTPTISSSSRARRTVAVGATTWANRAGSSTFSSGDRPGKRWNCWKTSPTCSRRQPSRGALAHGKNVGAVPDDGAGARPLDSGENMDQRRLARARRSLDRDLAPPAMSSRVDVQHVEAPAIGKRVSDAKVPRRKRRPTTGRHRSRGQLTVVGFH